MIIGDSKIVLEGEKFERKSVYVHLIAVWLICSLFSVKTEDGF